MSDIPKRILTHLEKAERLLTDVIAVWQAPDKTVLECLKDLNRIIADLKGAKDCEP